LILITFDFYHVCQFDNWFADFIDKAGEFPEGVRTRIKQAYEFVYPATQTASGTFMTRSGLGVEQIVGVPGQALFLMCFYSVEIS